MFFVTAPHLNAAHVSACASLCEGSAKRNPFCGSPVTVTLMSLHLSYPQYEEEGRFYLENA